jgi:hypothetical protein
MKKLQSKKITLIGAGAIGSFSALTLSKMGAMMIEVYDEDGVTEHNLPNQFYRIKDVEQFKVDALNEIIQDFTGYNTLIMPMFYTNQPLHETVIVTTDSMSSRCLVWEQFLKQKQCKNYIEARMGAQLGVVYTIRDKSKENIKFYEKTLYKDEDVAPLRCSERAIIDNVLMLSSLICRSYRSVISKEEYPREIVFNMQNINKASFMIRD